MARSVKSLIDPYLWQWPRVSITSSTVQCIQSSTKAITNAKATEGHHIKDNRKTTIRFNTGHFGELLVAKYLGLEFFDLSAGRSKDNNIPDLIRVGLAIGIKTSDYQKDNSAVVCRKSDFAEPQIIVVKLSSTTGAIAGYASGEIINAYRSDEYVKDKRMLDKKTGFYGYKYLVPFANFEELSILAKDYTL